MLCSVRRLLPCCYVPSGGHADGHGGVSAQTCHTLVHSVHRCFMLAMVSHVNRAAVSASWAHHSISAWSAHTHGGTSTPNMRILVFSQKTHFAGTPRKW